MTKFCVVWNIFLDFLDYYLDIRLCFHRTRIFESTLSIRNWNVQIRDNIIPITSKIRSILFSLSFKAVRASEEDIVKKKTKIYMHTHTHAHEQRYGYIFLFISRSFDVSLSFFFLFFENLLFYILSLFLIKNKF